MDVGQRAFDRAADVEVEVAGEGGVDAALQADLDGAALPRLLGAADDLVDRDEVRPAAQVVGQLAFREGAEAAAEVADVRVVDVARDDVGDGVAVHLAAERIGAARGPRGGRARARAGGSVTSSSSSSSSVPTFASAAATRGDDFGRSSGTHAYGFPGYARSGEEVGGHPGMQHGASGEPAAQRSSRAEALRVRAAQHRGRDGRDRPSARGIGHVLGIDRAGAARGAGRGPRSPRAGARPPATAPPGSRGRPSPARRRPSR